MDALKLKMRAKDQLQPLLTDLMSSYTKFQKSSEWQGRPKILQWSVSRLHFLLERVNERAGSSR